MADSLMLPASKAVTILGRSHRKMNAQGPIRATTATTNAGSVIRGGNFHRKQERLLVNSETRSVSCWVMVRQRVGGGKLRNTCKAAPNGCAMSISLKV